MSNEVKKLFNNRVEVLNRDILYRMYEKKQLYFKLLHVLYSVIFKMCGM